MSDFLHELGRNLGDAAGRMDGAPPRRPRPPVLAVVGLVLLLAGVAIGTVVVGGGQDAPGPTGNGEITAEPSPAPTPPRPAPTPELVSVDEALARVDRYIDIPIGVPAGLPAGTLALKEIHLSEHGGVRSANLSLRLPGERILLSITYGAAGFDGCGPTDPRMVDVNDEPGLLTTSDSSGQVVSTVVWPATLPAAEGSYALTGPFSPKEILDLARSMDLYGYGALGPTGC